METFDNGRIFDILSRSHGIVISLYKILLKLFPKMISKMEFLSPINEHMNV